MSDGSTANIFSPEKFLIRYGVSCSVLGYDTTQYVNLAERLGGTHCIFEVECGSGSCVAPNVSTSYHTLRSHKTGDHIGTIPSALNGNSPVSCCNCSTIRTCLVARTTTYSSYPDFLYKKLAIMTVLNLQVQAALRTRYTAPSEIMTASTKYKPEYLQYVRFGLTYFELWNTRSSRCSKEK